MTLKEIIDLLEFWIDKSGTSYFTKAELCAQLDAQQIGLMADYMSRDAASTRIKEALAPFRATYDFAPTDTASGKITVPADRAYMRLLDLSVGDEPVPIVNEDERKLRLKCQIDPVDAEHPIAEIVGIGAFQLWPKTPATGTVTFRRRPKAPVYNTTGTGRGAAYTETGSQNLEWPDEQKLEIATRVLAALGINLSEGEIAQYAENKATEQIQNLKH
jgi:hypothetical protein